MHTCWGVRRCVHEAPTRGLKPRGDWDRWKEKGARLGAALPPGRILGLAFQLVPGVSFSSQRIKHILLNSLCA